MFHVEHNFKYTEPQRHNSLPTQPGVYIFIDQNQKYIYVGKAKNLKKRVSSYFTKNHDNHKTQILVSKVSQIHYMTVETEGDALLLENSLIKQHQPRYNILLKDDKTFPWICIKSEPFPRVFSTRTRTKDGSRYYGPWSSVSLMKTLLILIRKLYPLRTCNLNLTPEAIKEGRYKPCLEYQIGNCLAPCTGKQAEEDYNRQIASIHQILRGYFGPVLDELKKQMNLLAGELKFEEAQQIKEKHELISRHKSKSTVVSTSVKHCDVFSFLNDSEYAYINYLSIIEGAIVQSHNLEFRRKMDESPEDLLLLAATELRNAFGSTAPELVLPFHPGYTPNGAKITLPKKGDKLALLELSLRNARSFRQDCIQERLKSQTGKGTQRLLAQLAKELNLNRLPRHIECFDNSNLQGTNPVASCVIFIDGKPAKKEYRHFHIKTVEGPDDFASMREIIARRYNRVISESLPVPDLVLVDGGKGQLSSAFEILSKLFPGSDMDIIGIAKRLEEIFKPGDPYPLYLDKRSESLKLIQRIRDEAHRFAITFHRNTRSKKLIESPFLKIKGIGPKTSDLLLKKYRTQKNILESDLRELEKLIGKKKADLLINELMKNSTGGL